MPNPEKRQDVLSKLLRRLNALTCLHPTTKASLSSWLTSTATAEEVQAWREKNLAFLERWIDLVKARPFAHLCQRLKRLDDWEALRRALGLRAGALDCDWLEHAKSIQAAPNECLWCLAQQLALPATLDGTRMEAAVRVLLSRSVPCPSQAANLLEAFVPLAQEHYSDAQDLRRRMERFASKRMLTHNSTASYVAALADALRAYPVNPIRL